MSEDKTDLGCREAYSNAILLVYVNLSTFLESFIAAMPPAVFDKWKDVFDVSLGKLGAVSTVRQVAKALVLPGWGWLSDRTNRKLMFVTIGLTSGGLCILIASVVRNSFITLMVLYALVGIAVAGLDPGRTSLLTDVVPAKKRGVQFGILGVSTTVGNIAGTVAAALIADTGENGWKYAFLVGGVVAVLFGITCFLLVIEPPRGKQELFLVVEQEKSTELKLGPVAGSDPDDQLPKEETMQLSTPNTLTKQENPLGLESAGTQESEDSGIVRTAGDEGASPSPQFIADPNNPELAEPDPVPPTDRQDEKCGRGDVSDLEPQKPTAVHEDFELGVEDASALVAAGLKGKAEDIFRSDGVMAGRYRWQHVLSRKMLWVLLVTRACAIMPWSGLSFLLLWLDLVGLSNGQRLIVFVLSGLGVLAGFVAGGKMGDKAAKKYPNKGRLVIGQILVIACIPPLFIMTQMLPHKPSYMPLFCVLAFATGAIMPTVLAAYDFPAVAETVVPWGRATAYALISTASSAVGSFASILVGYFAESLWSFDTKVDISDMSAAQKSDGATALANSLLLVAGSAWVVQALAMVPMYSWYPKERAQAEAAVPVLRRLGNLAKSKG
eukprot:TRINITY_DN67759_c3_g1_i2.p1 TRINITY_DN67759_c3_g1~~TRINITY_DN67759_c3_g1_i2.p1  ORF type:complete len:610 (+),score=75.05 TRINITY_DN67759_c3_g1_i2:62-1891(+)